MKFWSSSSAKFRGIFKSPDGVAPALEAVAINLWKCDRMLRRETLE